MEKTNLIIGGAFNYNWSHLKYWVKSIKDTGYNGMIALCVEKVSPETVNKLQSEGVEVIECETLNSNIAPHVSRFFHIASFLEKEKEFYNNVIVTDVRDVIFQKNPSLLLEELLFESGKNIVVSSEGMRYKNEPWGDNNLLQVYGKDLHQTYRENLIYNVGTIAGRCENVTKLLSILFQKCLKSPIAICDQAVFNVMIHDPAFETNMLKTTNRFSWAIQSGTTIYAVAAGAGDLGQIMSLSEYQKLYEDEQPILKDGKVYNQSGELFTIVHQWDRIPSLQQEIYKKYANS